MTGHALDCDGNFSARSLSGAKDFLLDGCHARALFLAKDFGVGERTIRPSRAAYTNGALAELDFGFCACVS